MHFTDRILRYFPYKQHEKENNLASDPICLWLMSLYGYWLRILYAYQHIGSHSTYLKTYRLLCHRYDSLSCATKWSFFSQRIGSLAVLFSQMTLVFYGKSILKAKQTLFVREKTIKHFLLRSRSAKLTELFIFSSFSNAN